MLTVTFLTCSVHRADCFKNIRHKEPDRPHITDGWIPCWVWGLGGWFSPSASSSQCWQKADRGLQPTRANLIVWELSILWQDALTVSLWTLSHSFMSFLHCGAQQKKKQKTPENAVAEWAKNYALLIKRARNLSLFKVRSNPKSVQVKIKLFASNRYNAYNQWVDHQINKTYILNRQKNTCVWLSFILYA